MPPRQRSHSDRRITDEVTDLLVRGVFAFTLAVARLADQRRDEFLARQDPRLN